MGPCGREQIATMSRSTEGQAFLKAKLQFGILAWLWRGRYDMSPGTKQVPFSEAYTVQSFNAILNSNFWAETIASTILRQNTGIRYCTDIGQMGPTCWKSLRPPTVSGLLENVPVLYQPWLASKAGRVVQQREHSCGPFFCECICLDLQKSPK